MTDNQQPPPAEGSEPEKQETNTPPPQHDVAHGSQGEAAHPPQGESAHPPQREKPQGEKSLGGGDATYKVDNAGQIDKQHIGDTNNITTNNIIYNTNPEQIRDVLKSELNSIFTSVQGGIFNAAQSSNHYTAARNPFVIKVPENAPDEGQEQGVIPATEEAIAGWYGLLDSYTQCFVQAMAIFAGATIHEIAYATSTLFKPVEEGSLRRSRPVLALQQTEYVQKVESRSSLIELKKRCYVIIERVEREECLWWQDTDAAGSSQFQIRLLSFLARSAPLWPDSQFLSQLESWMQNLEGSNGWRASRAQGIIWWHYVSKLRNEVNIWSNHEEWYRAAYLLYGTYEIDRFHNINEANDFHASFVLQCAYRWVKVARKKGNGKKGCAAALTYMLVGLHELPIALRGLDSLLELPKTSQAFNSPLDVQGSEEEDGEDEWAYALSEDTYEGVVVSYYELAQAGHLQEILQHLAQRIETTSHYRIALTGMKYDERESRRLQRSLTLIASFDIFFRIAQQSLQNAKYRAWVNYDLSKPFPALLTLANTDGREVLLVGILNGEWSAWISALLCAAIIENIGEYRKVAFILLQKWAELILKDQSPHPDQIRERYVHFLVEIGKMTLHWSTYWADLGLPVSPVLPHYRRGLEQWEKRARKRDQPVMRALVQEVLEQLLQGSAK